MKRLTEKHYLGADHYIKCSDSCYVTKKDIADALRSDYKLINNAE